MKKGFKGLVVWVVLEGILLGGFLWWILGVAGINVGKPEAEGFVRGDYICAGEKGIMHAMAAYNKGIYYDGKLYVFDEDTYLMQVWQAEIVDPCSGITWDDEKQELVIHYGEGLSVVSGEWLFGHDN